jgi:ATP-binding protein involved in chromosome partitioning
MSSINLDVIKQALNAVPAPDGSPSLAASPCLSPIAVEGAVVSFAINVEPGQAPHMERVRQAAEAAVRTVKGVTDVRVVLTADKPVLSKAQRAAQRGQAIPGVKHIIAIASGKGGVGKSTVAANLALAFAAQGLKTGLMDADVYGPSLPVLFGVTERPAVVDKRITPHERFGIKLMSIGFLVDADAALIWRGPMVITAITQLLRDVEWGELDVLVVDLPPGTGDVQLTLAQHVPLDGAVIVSTPQDMALADVRRGAAMFGKVNVPLFGVIENMSYYCCPACGNKDDIFGHGGAEAEARNMNVDFLGGIPLDRHIRHAADQGIPVMADAHAPAALLFKNIAGLLIAKLGLPPAHTLPDIIFE